ncbi:hypothetical protein KL905_001040 [Ogataea polymorpha]|uniref:Uncharacterized protein n=1 Tax=Ogataea polymorpha TaxID=460523 RepID=A0A1B7SH87_9ASCO|nr:uncharacterized protein OGAPODRAFT_16600 [Ogataea polymorpha]KAG7890621.1 hypothetical protein KL936_001905 [Ogataea polymorpha]KAG7891146.1 hypothetical protein KL908_003899 [Ogataea polymorpha]KAG7901723.1 hypothetical protein KL935_001683 [Ogataea polymorpha]KAG7910241.1 hypothetical protein KL907_001132 [Ogataea polymorpha]KAG7910757.1 hypothetical protein KL906_001137 [Ogataea polymorpha]
METLAPYTDPLINLLKDTQLNKDKSKSDELIRHINSINDHEIKTWCIQSFEILKDLETIELKIYNWEFQALEFKLSQSLILDEEDQKKRTFNSSLARKVANNCLELHKNLQQLGIEIDEVNSGARFMTPLQRISDPGTILTELMLRVMKLRSSLIDQVSIHYSKAKLVNIGIDLENLIYEEEDRKYGDITEETVINYKLFINNLLQQINDYISTGDTIGVVECISIVTEVEKMFETMKLDRLSRQPERLLSFPGVTSDELCERPDSPASSSVTMSDTLCGDDENPEKADYLKRAKIERFRSFNSAHNSSLHKTTLTEKLPFLMHAFEEARSIEEDIRGVMESSDIKVTDRKLKESPPRPIASSSSSSIMEEPGMKFSLYRSLNNPLLNALMSPTKPVYIQDPSHRFENQKPELTVHAKPQHGSHLTAVSGAKQNKLFHDIGNVID